MLIGLRDSLILGLCIVLHLTYRYRRRALLPLPPGPSRWPLVGNTFSIPLVHPHHFYKHLGERLGSKMIYLEAMGQSILVINDIEIAQELLGRRSALYSSRPHFRMITEVADFNHIFALMPYGDDWRVRRRIFQQHFSERNLPRIQEREVEFVRKGLLPNILTSPNEFHDHIRHCIGGLSTSMTYGLPAKRRNDPLMHFAEKTFTTVNHALAPGNFFVNIFGPLKYLPSWMPGAGFKKVAKEIRERLTRLMDDPYQEALQRIDDGTAVMSFVSESLDRCRDQPDFELQAQYTKQTAVQVFGAFFETTVAVVMTFILTMLKNPEIQRRAQYELDMVIGPDRLPEFSDIPQLPYLSAVIREVLRWNPIGPLGVPHRTSDEDVFMGYYIPKGCTVMANAYAMLHDEEVFSDPSEFKPERFLKNGVLRDDIPNPETIATFGFGRRVCPGAHIALSTLYISAASILCLFDIQPALDANGKIIDVVPEFTASITSEPLSFKCKLTPRQGKDVEDLLRDYMGFETI
ncbi:hypothetical protein D9756_009678 [Leucocoprinus leucothites]|uniref:O-methylsterigmatocystin oxidoreductase n=1 Tax=Leucocoprinus leucothites TaxID=201217 RepID=A0A8H5CUW9_9AGAR|nr:hypothetical protein D9756_009678 [Leucoagaricus leucothites]